MSHLNMYDLLTSPTIDGLFAIEELAIENRTSLILCLLRRHSVIAEQTGDTIGYHFSKEGAAEAIINMLYNAYVESFDDAITINLTVSHLFQEAERWLQERLLVDYPHSRFVPTKKQPDLDLIPIAEIPGMVQLDGCLMPENQMALIAAGTFKDYINVSRRIVDAVVFDNNVVFILGEATDEIVMLNQLLQNSMINVIWTDKYLNILGSHTYRLS